MQLGSSDSPHSCCPPPARASRWRSGRPMQPRRLRNHCKGRISRRRRPRTAACRCSPCPPRTGSQTRSSSTSSFPNPTRTRWSPTKSRSRSTSSLQNPTRRRWSPTKSRSSLPTRRQSIRSYCCWARSHRCRNFRSRNYSSRPARCWCRRGPSRRTPMAWRNTARQLPRPFEVRAQPGPRPGGSRCQFSRTEDKEAFPWCRAPLQSAFRGGWRDEPALGTSTIATRSYLQGSALACSNRSQCGRSDRTPRERSFASAAAA
jgi:hypothetical protein